jgi:8-oxo-dGTP pyrophosphatase MutT (NUDIX family)
VARLSFEDGDSKPAFGLAASLPLGGAQQKATLEVAQAAFALAEEETGLDAKRRNADYVRWLHQYRSAVKVLRQGFAETAVQDKHAKMEKLFLAGRVNASLIIEAHRQMYEHLVSRHEIEWKAMEAYWNLRYLTGQIREGDL